MYGPTLPSTGGGILLLAGAAYGANTTNYLVVGICCFLFLAVAANMVRLRIGENRLRNRDQ